MKFPIFLVKYGEYFSKPANFLKIAGLAFLYLLIGLFAYSFAIYLYFIFPTQSDLLEFFSLAFDISLWGVFFGYIPTFIGGIFLYFPIVSFYGTGKISRIGMALLGMFMGLISITSIAFLILVVSNRGFPPTFIIHYTFGSLIASLIGVFAGINAYTDIQKQFQDGRIG